MTFLNPLVLFGMIAAAIPLIIHLFNFRKPRKVDFSTLAFLKELQKSTMRRMRVKQWLLLLLRTLVIACLVLAFSRPTLQGGLSGWFGQTARSSIAIVVDNSLSMTLRDTHGAYLDQAKEVARNIVEQTDEGDEVFILRTVETSTARPASFRNKGPALDAIDALEARAGGLTLSQSLARAGVLLEAAPNLNKEIYLLSDLQRQTFADSLQLVVPDDVRIILLPLGTRTHSNVAVTEVNVVSRIIEAGQPVRLQATLHNFGVDPVEGYVASVFLEGERIAQATADLPAGLPTTLNFTATPQRRGWLSGEIRIEDDAFEYDNVRYFTLHVPERRQLLVVRGDGQRTDYIELALSPELTRGRVAFDLEIIPENRLPATGLAAYDAVVLVGVADLSTGEVAALQRYVENGSGVLVFPGERINTTDYNAFFQQVGGGQLTAFEGTVGGAQPVAGFDQVDLEHPLFEGVFDLPQTQTAARVESPDIFASAQYATGTGDEQTLIRLSNGQPFLQEIHHGDGAVLMMSVAPDLGWSDLPTRGLFIPLLYRSVYYLSSGGGTEPGGLLVGTAGELRIAGVADAEALRLVAPDGEEFTPEQRGLFGAILLQTPTAVSQTGIYDVRAGDQPVRKVAFNGNSRESDLNPLTASEAQSRLEALTDQSVRVLDVREADVGQRVAEAIVEERYGVELWNVFLLLALLFLLTEMLVAMQWKREIAAA